MGELPVAVWDSVISSARLQEPTLFSLETGSSELLATAGNAALVESVKVQQKAEAWCHVCPSHHWVAWGALGCPVSMSFLTNYIK